MAKYKDSFQTHSESLAAGGRGIVTAVENEDAHTKVQKARPPEFNKPKNQSNTPPIRTLADDLNSTVQSGQVSLASEALKTSASRREVRESEYEPIPVKAIPKKKKAPRGSSKSMVTFIAIIFVIFIGSLFLFMGRQGISLGSLSFSLPKISSFSFFFSLPSRNNSEVTPINPDTLLVADHFETFSFDAALGRRGLLENLTRLRSESAPGLTVVFLENTRTEGSAETDTPSKTDVAALLNAVDASVSSVLPRSITDYNLGFIESAGQTEVFLVAKIRSFDSSFAALLDWENNMALNLYGFMHENGQAIFSNERTFSDISVLGVDARELTVSREDEFGDTQTEPVLIYALPGKDTLVLTHSRKSLEEIITRLDIKN